MELWKAFSVGKSSMLLNSTLSNNKIGICWNRRKSDSNNPVFQRGSHDFGLAIREHRAISHYFDTAKDLKKIVEIANIISYQKVNPSF